jgi:hypothetical protein
MKRTLNLDFLVDVFLQDKQRYMSCDDDNFSYGDYLIENGVAYYKPYVNLFFVGDKSYKKTFDTFEEATLWYDRMITYISHKLTV